MIRTARVWGVFCETKDLLQLIRSSYNPAIKTTEAQILRPVLTCDILVLDDLGSERPTDWVEETMNYVVNTRYASCLRTWFTSNYMDPADGIEDKDDTLLARVGFRMRSRLSEMCEFVELHGADFRDLPPNHTSADQLKAASARIGQKLPTRANRGIKAHLRGDGKADLKWPGGRAGS